MKNRNRLRIDSKHLFFLQLSIVLLGLWSCQSDDKKNHYQVRGDEVPLVDDKYSLRADREKMNEVRQEVPVARQRENDEKAFLLELFSDNKKTPNSIRDKFDNFVRKKRDVFQKDLQKEREQFTQTERKMRDQFLRSIAENRKQFMQIKSSKESRDDFFKEQESSRKDYFANEREKRQDFESDVRERRKNFEDYIREKQNEFNQELKIFRQKQEEQKKLDQKKQTSTSFTNTNPPKSYSQAEEYQLEQDIKNAKSINGTTIESGE